MISDRDLLGVELLARAARHAAERFTIPCAPLTARDEIFDVGYAPLDEPIVLFDHTWSNGSLAWGEVDIRLDVFPSIRSVRNAHITVREYLG